MKTTHQTKRDIHVLVFGTNIHNEIDVEKAGFVLNNYTSILRWTVDLHDWERVLKVEAFTQCSYLEVEKLIGNLGFRCYELSH